MRLQVNVEAMPPGPENPYNIGFFHTETELQTELSAIRDVDPAKSRIWKIKNPNSINSMSGVLPCDALMFCNIEFMSIGLRTLLLDLRWGSPAFT